MRSDETHTQAVDTYVNRVPAYARPICRRLRALARQAAPHWQESIKANSPSYTGCALVCTFAAFHKHVALIFCHGARLADPDGVFSSGDGQGSARSVRLSSVEEIEEEKILRLFAEASALDRKDATNPEPEPATEPEPASPQQALSPELAAAFDSLSPSYRREYIEWISSGKRPGKLAGRLESAIPKSGKGKDGEPNGKRREK